MRRREWLALAATAVTPLIAGCGTNVDRPTAKLKMTRQTDGSYLPRFMYSISSEQEESERWRRFTAILDGGETFRRAHPPFPENQSIYYNQTIYELSYNTSDETPAVSYAVTVENVEGTPTSSNMIRFSDLPDVDKRQLAERGLADGGLTGIGTTFLYTQSQINQSVLVPEPVNPIIVWENGTHAQWIVERGYDQTIATYTYTAETITSAAAYSERLRDRFAFELTDLTAEQTEIVETAIAEDVFVVPSDQTPTAAFTSLVEQFRSHEQIRWHDDDLSDQIEGHYIVSYDDDTYWARLSIDEDEFQFT